MEKKMKNKKRKKRDPMARELLTSGKYRMRVVKSAKAYSRKEKHKKGSDYRYSEPFLWFFSRFRIQ